MTDSGLILERGRWYAFSMLPGYGDGFTPYYSPIKIGSVTAMKTGRSELFVEFFSPCYAEGVQDFRTRVRLLGRQRHHLVLAELSGDGHESGRHLIVGTLSSR